MQQADKTIQDAQKQLEKLEPFIQKTKGNESLSIENVSIDLQQKPKKNEESPKEKANTELNTAFRKFIDSNERLKVIGQYRGQDILAHKNVAGINVFLGNSIQDGFELVRNIGFDEIRYHDIDYMRRFSNGYTKLSNGEYKKALEATLSLAKDSKQKTQKAYDKANNTDLSKEQQSLQDKTYRLAEIEVFLSRGTDKQHELLKSVLGKNYKEILQEKFAKEKEAKGLT